MDPLISVIIPVYNVELYVKDCLDSVSAQTYTNLEIIVVDDGATDRSGEICEECAKNDRRMVVYHKQNGGLPDARNYGIDRCHGEYILFIDSDDLIAPDYVEYMYSGVRDTGADVAASGYIPFWETVPEPTPQNEAWTVVTSEEMIRKMALQDGASHDPDKLYRHSLWGQFRFPNVLYEDFASTYYVVSHAGTCAISSAAKLYYRKRPDSIMGKQFDERQLVLLDIADGVTGWLTETYPNFREEALRLRLVTYCKVLKNMLDVKAELPDVEKRIVDTVRANAPAFLRAPCVRAIDKIKVAALCCGKRVFYWVYLIGDARNKRNREH